MGVYILKMHCKFLQNIISCISAKYQYIIMSDFNTYGYTQNFNIRVFIDIKTTRHGSQWYHCLLQNLIELSENLANNNRGFAKIKNTIPCITLITLRLLYFMLCNQDNISIRWMFCLKTYCAIFNFVYWKLVVSISTNCFWNEALNRCCKQ